MLGRQQLVAQSCRVPYYFPPSRFTDPLSRPFFYLPDYVFCKPPRPPRLPLPPHGPTRLPVSNPRPPTATRGAAAKQSQPPAQPPIPQTRPPTITFVPPPSSCGLAANPKAVPIPRIPTSLLNLALANNIFVEALCGGQCCCTTCAMVIGKGAGVVARAGGDEKDLLDEDNEEPEGDDVRRLACQVTVGQEMDGLVVRVQGSE